MALFGINKTSPKILANPFQQVLQGLNKIWAKAPTRDRMELPELAHKSPRLDPIFIIARAIAGTEWNTYNKIDLKKNGKTAEPFVNPEILDLFDYPIKRYPEIDWYALCYSTVATIKAVGEYGWLKIRDDRGKLIELDPIPPGWIMRTPTYGDPTYTIYPFGVTAGVALHVSPDDFVYFKRPDLSDPYGRGRGDSEQLTDEFEMDELMAKTQKNLNYNDATPPYIITAPGMPQDQADAFKKSWMQKLGGYMHKREPGVLGFDAKVQTLAMTPIEMDMIESRKFIRDEVYMHYQIPPEIYGNIQNSNRSTINSAEYLFYKNVLSTEYRFFERVITRQIIAVEFDKNLCFKFEEVVPDDEDFKLEVYNAGVTNGTITKNEWRKAFSLPALKSDVGDVLQTSFSNYTIPINGPALPPPGANGGNSGETEDESSEDMPIDEKPIEEASKAIFALIQKSRELEDVKKKTITIVSKYNENHDESGRFAPGDGSTSASSVTSSQAKDILSGNAPVPEGCYVHGREPGSGGMDSGEYVREFTQDINVAKQYAGRDGEIYMVSPGPDTVTCNFQSENSKDMDEFCDNLKAVYEDKKNGEFSSIVSDIRASKGLDEVTADDFISEVRFQFCPEDIVDSARAYDNPEWVGLLEYAKGTSDGWPDFITVPKGGAVLLPGMIDKVDSVNLTAKAKEESKNIKHNSVTIKVQKSKARREAIWKAFDSRATAKEGMFIEAVKKYSGKQREQVLSAIGSFNIPTKAIRSKAEDGEDEEDYRVSDTLDKVFTDKANSALKSALAAAWLASLASGRDHFYDMMGEDPKDPKLIPSLNVTNKLFNAFVEENGLNKATFINQTTDDELKSKLRQIISDGISNGDTLNTTKKAIQDAVGEVYDGFEGYRAERLARTETAGSVNAGSFMTAKASGMTQKQWMSQLDSRTRGSDPKDEFDHIAADGETVGIEDDFVQSGEPMQYPLDPAGSAGNVIECRCSCLWGNDDIPLDDNSKDDSEEE